MSQPPPLLNWSIEDQRQVKAFKLYRHQDGTTSDGQTCV